MKSLKPYITYFSSFLMAALFLSSCVSVKQYRDLETRLEEMEQNRFTVSDDDNDGVLNELDKEPNTPRGAPVNTRGIQLDSDKDGFPDHRDREPFSPPNFPVDDRGIAIRSDKDYGWDTEPEEETEIPKGEDGRNDSVGLEEFFHQVQQGETLFSIAQKYDVEVNQIRGWNQLSSNEPINPGQNLIIFLPEGTEIPEEEPVVEEPVVPQIPATHVVQKGDTLYSISRQYNVSVADIKSLNSIGTSTIYPGQELRLR